MLAELGTGVLLLAIVAGLVFLLEVCTREV
jgi:hypothetical protein